MMTMFRQAHLPLFLAALAALSACTPTSDTSEVAQKTAEAGLVPLAIVSDSGRHEYRVEVARTPQEQAQGLMYRQTMAQDRGMIFPFSPPRQASFWMQNTYLPLDMIFLTQDGRIESIAADTVPMSTQPYRSQGPVAAVLELNAGEAARIGAAPGDKVIYDLDATGG